MNNEYTHLNNDYLCHNPIIRNDGFHLLAADELNTILHNLVPFERPDMYAFPGERLVLLEHFEFDASRRTRKGMNGLEKERRTEEELAQHKLSQKENLTKISYPISLENLVSNFESVYQGHYRKIDAYVDHARDAGLISKDDTALIGFFIENRYPPYLEVRLGIHEIAYVQTKQFQQTFLKSPKLDFVLFGCYYESEPQIFYVDKESCTALLQPIDCKRLTITR